jgi:hypothetical protein
MSQRYYYRNLKEKGYGTRNTIATKVKKRVFPAPLEDESGRPFWTDEMLDEHDASLGAYHPAPVKHLEGTREVKEARK